MQFAWLSLAIAATVAYHVVLKLTPASANPFLSLLVTYAVVTLVFAAALALAVTIVALDLGFLLLYRSGYDISLGALVTQSAAAMVLLLVGALVFREKLSLANGVGIALCLAGLWLVNRR